MTVFFTSDQHFGHAAARGFYGRPFASIADMDNQMIVYWNSVVGPTDEVWHLGDFAVRQSSERISGLLKRLHGHKHLIAGNNDNSAVRESNGWLSVQDYAEVNLKDVRLVLCHYHFGVGATWQKAQSTSTVIVMAGPSQCRANLMLVSMLFDL